MGHGLQVKNQHILIRRYVSYSTRRGEAKDAGMAGVTQIIPQMKFGSFKSRSSGSSPLNEFGEPNMGNPSVRFDEGRERVGHWPPGLSIHALLPTLRSGELCASPGTNDVF